MPETPATPPTDDTVTPASETPAPTPAPTEQPTPESPAPAVAPPPQSPPRTERNNTRSNRGTDCSGKPYRWGHSWYRRGAWGRSLYVYTWDQWGGYWWGTPRWYSPYHYSYYSWW